MLDHYLNDASEADDWRASPLMADDFVSLPSALVITADHDPLCEEGKEYADRLTADGVRVDYVYFGGTFHGFMGYSGLVEVGASALGLVCRRLKEALHAPAVVEASA